MVRIVCLSEKSLIFPACFSEIRDFLGPLLWRHIIGAGRLEQYLDNTIHAKDGLPVFFKILFILHTEQFVFLPIHKPEVEQAVQKVSVCQGREFPFVGFGHIFDCWQVQYVFSDSLFHSWHCTNSTNKLIGQKQSLLQGICSGKIHIKTIRHDEFLDLVCGLRQKNVAKSSDINV